MPRFSEAAQRSIPALRASQDFAGNVPPRFMLPASLDREDLAGAFEGNFHIGQCSRVEAFRDHHGSSPSLFASRHLFCADAQQPASSFRGSSALGEEQSLQVDRIPENARAFHRLDSLGTGRHPARVLEGGQRFGFQVELRFAVFVL
jgi:hypothetical protein